MHWILKTQRLTSRSNPALNQQQMEVNAHIIDYFVHRDITYKLNEEKLLDE